MLLGQEDASDTKIRILVLTRLATVAAYVENVETENL